MLPEVRVLIVAVNAERIVEKNEVVVAFVAVSSVAEVVARVVFPETVSVVKSAVMPESTEAKNELEVALVVFKLVMVPDAEVRSVMVVVAKVVVPTKVLAPAMV